MNEKGCRKRAWKRKKVPVQKRGVSLLLTAVMTLSLISFPITGNAKTEEDLTVTAQVQKDNEGGSTDSDKSSVLAFPGAEGGGRFASGGRGQEVYTVTNLNDYGISEEPIAGSLRYGLKSNRTIVFAVAGTIELKQTLSFKGLSNITLAGQTAPGDGITLSGWATDISNSENLIIRYLRFRPGAANIYNGGDSMDSLWGRDNRTFIIDHCSLSFCTDEGLSTYRGEDGTVQWTIVSESLTLSGHSKGRHGYGGIFGGNNVTFHHNLIANHTSRNPRIGGGYAGAADADHVAAVQVSNNVLYNWGFNTIYGGGFANTNYINNYVKAGPGTRDNVADRVADAGEVKKVGGFYINGNYLEGNKKVSADNSLGIRFSGEKEGENKTTIAEVPYSSEGIDSLAVEPAVQVYEKVLKTAGATYPRRDAIDARITAEVRSGKGKYINSEDEIGGYPALEEARTADFDADQDGMDDAWELRKGLDPTNKEDGQVIREDGYSNLEHYLNSLVQMDKEADNPPVSVSEGSDLRITLKPASGYGLPTAVRVTVGGAEAETEYNPDTGSLAVLHVTGLVVIWAEGVLNGENQDLVSFKITDPGGLLKLSAFGSTMFLTQSATKGSMPQSAGDPGSNVSYLGFPDTAETQTMSLDLKITDYSITGEAAAKTGLFVGAFQLPEKGGLYTSLGFRGYDSNVGSDSLSGYWIKGTGTAGNGSPKYTVSVGTKYHVVFEKNASGFLAVFTNQSEKTTDSKQFKTSEMLLTPEAEVSYGLALVGVSAEINNLTLKDKNGTVLYNQNNTYKEDGSRRRKIWGRGFRGWRKHLSFTGGNSGDLLYLSCSQKRGMPV